LLLISLVLTQFVNIVVAPVAWREAIAAVGLAWIMIGGFGLLLSVLVTRDIAVMLMFYLVVTILEQVHKNMPAAHWVKPLLAILPPFQLLASLESALLRGAPLVAADLWHVVIFGAGCASLATYLVRRLPLVR
jgi:hypothetical protein